MKRRDFLALAAAATAPTWPLAGLAQVPAKVPRVAFVDGAAAIADMTPNSSNPGIAAFFEEMARLGFVEGRTIYFERYSAPSADAQQNAPVIVGSSPDLIYLTGAATTALAIIPLTTTIPMVSLSGDPLGQGIVNNLAHPGGNVTAVATTASSESEGKVLTILAEAIPNARRVAYIGVGQAGQISPAQQGYARAAAAAAANLGLSMTTMAARDPADEQAFRDVLTLATDAKAEMVQFGLHTQINFNTPILARLSLDARIPAIAPYTAFTQAGGLVSYASNIADNQRKAAAYAAMILHGENPGDLPVIQPTVFDLVINLKTAKAIGVTIPPSLLAQATEVIQ